MRFYRLPSVLTVLADVCGGLFLTVLSGLYVLKPLVMDAEIIYFGFPFAWFQEGRGGLFYTAPWQYHFVWHNFAVDFVIYGLSVSGVVHLYFARRLHARPAKSSKARGLTRHSRLLRVPAAYKIDK